MESELNNEKEVELFELFPKVVAKYNYDQEKHQEIVQICENIRKEIGTDHPEYSSNSMDPQLKHYYNQSTSSLLYERPELEEFRKWCCDCAKHFMTKVLDYIIEEDNEILVTDSWLNWCSVERANQVRHNHHNCIVSGTYYVHRQEWVHAGIEFYRPNIELHPVMAQKRHVNDNSNKYTTYLETLYPSSGNLILWSSELLHGYNGLTNFWDGRTSLSMNFLPHIIDNGKYSFTVKKYGE